MKIYHYHPTTGEHLGEGLADESPLEPGVYLIPAHATDIEPPTPGENQRAAWQDGAWILQNVPVQMYCYYNNGLSYKVVDSNYVAQSEEVLFPNEQTENDLLIAFPDYATALKQQKINELRAKYEPLYNSIWLAWAACSARGDMDEFTADLASLDAEFATELEAIK